MIELRNAENGELDGTSFQGEIDMSYEDMICIFGKPHGDDGHKVDAEWSFVASSWKKGPVAFSTADDVYMEEVEFSLYNWKDGRNYCGSEGLPLSDITDWHIGGHNHKAVEVVHSIIAERKENKKFVEDHLEVIGIGTKKGFAEELKQKIVDEVT